MSKFRLLALAGLLAALASAGFAQTVANLSIVSGDGQLICSGCTSSNFGNYEPLVVKATDANGNPVTGATITWTNLGNVDVGSTTTTAADGTSSSSQPYPNGAGAGGAAYLQSQIVASAGTPSVTFVLSQAIPSTSFPIGSPEVSVSAPFYGGIPLYQVGSVSGQSGTRGATPITLTVMSSGFTGGAPVPGISVRLINASSTATSTIACATGPSADPGSVLTDSTGTATCTPVFGGTAGSGGYYVLVGGVTKIQTNTTPGPAGTEGGFDEFGYAGYPLQYTVTAAATPGMIQIVSGNSQSATPGHALASALVAKVTDVSGNPISGQAVTFTVAPSTAGTVTPATATSANDGTVSTTLTLSSSAVGAVQVKVALTGNVAISNTFSETANVQLSGLVKNSGDQQSAITGAAFAQPLVVTVNGSNGQPLANYPVQFAVTAGSATLSASSATSNGSGQAQVTVTAGSTVGSVTVTATAGSYTQTFTLTVTPPGPVLTSASFYNAAGFQQGSLSPCAIAAIIAPGIAPGIQGIAGSQIAGEMPTQIALGTAGTVVSVAFAGTPAPIYSASSINGQQQLTFQVPCQVTPGASVPVTVNVGAASVTVNVAVQPASPGIFTSPVPADNVVRAAAVRPDGTYVTTSNPARIGEVIRIYATGLGATTPSISTGGVPPLGSDPVAQGQVIVGYGNSSGGGGGVTAISAVALEGTTGVFEIQFQIPADAATGNNVALSMGVVPAGSNTLYGSNTTKLPIQ